MKDWRYGRRPRLVVFHPEQPVHWLLQFNKNIISIKKATTNFALLIQILVLNGEDEASYRKVNNGTKTNLWLYEQIVMVTISKIRILED